MKTNTVNADSSAEANDPGFPTPTPSGFFIVNNVDIPSELYIAEKRDNGKFYYAHPSLKNVKEYWGMTPTNPTPVEDFGIIIDVKVGVLVGAVSDSIPVCATYRDGRPRRWQGAPVFAFYFHNAEPIRAAQESE